MTATSTGRVGSTTTALLDGDFFSVADVTSGGASAVGTTKESGNTVSGGRFSETYSVEIPQGNRSDDGFLLVLLPDIFSDANDNDQWDSGEVRYLTPEDDERVVWFATEGLRRSDKPTACGVSGLTGVDPSPPVIEAYPEEREFRTCFTLWGYDANDRFLVDGDDVSIEDFEERLKTATLDELEIVSYFTSSRELSIFRIGVS